MISDIVIRSLNRSFSLRSKQAAQACGQDDLFAVRQGQSCLVMAGCDVVFDDCIGWDCNNNCNKIYVSLIFALNYC